jgi:hypothetical protein
MLEDFLKFVKDIGFTLTIIRDNYIYLSYGRYTITIYNPEEHSGFEKRYSLEFKKNEHNVTYITSGSETTLSTGRTTIWLGEKVTSNKINFTLDDLEVLKNEFKDIIRDRKLKELGI